MSRQAPPWIAALLLFCAASTAYSQNSPVTIRKGALPTDPEYWKFNEWYLNHSVVNLIVGGQDSRHLVSVITELKELHERNVLIGRVVVVGGSSPSQLDERIKADDAAVIKNINKGRKGRLITLEELRAIRAGMGMHPALPQLARDLELGYPKGISGMRQLLDKLGLENSPAWIVQYRGKLYIYEGLESISRYFTKQGQFTGGIDE